MGRAGAFSANFAPDTLDAFRTLCKSKGEQYTKVLERFAEIYVATDGAIPSEVPVPSASASRRSPTAVAATNGDLTDRVERLERSDGETVETFEDIFSRIEKIEKHLGLGRHAN